MRVKIRNYKLELPLNASVWPGNFRQVRQKDWQLIWDEDIYFPKELQAALLEEIMALTSDMGKLNRYTPPAQVAKTLQYVEFRLNGALDILKVKYRMTADPEELKKQNRVKCGIFMKDPYFDFY